MDGSTRGNVLNSKAPPYLAHEYIIYFSASKAFQAFESTPAAHNNVII